MLRKNERGIVGLVLLMLVALVLIGMAISYVYQKRHAAQVGSLVISSVNI